MLEHWWNVMASLDEDATLHRPPRPSSEAPPMTERQPFTPPIVEEIPVHDDPSGGDIPTKSDPNLRGLVERELELHRKRKGTK